MNKGSYTSGKGRLLGPVVALLLACQVAFAQDHPARVSVVEGTVSVARADHVDWNAVAVNYPVWEGDRLVLQQNSRVEVELNRNSLLRLGPGTDLIVTKLSAEEVELHLLIGSVVVRSYSSLSFTILSGTTTTFVKTPGVYELGLSDSGRTVVRVRKGVARAVYDEGALDLQAGDSLMDRGQGGEVAENTPLDGDEEFLYWSDRLDAGRVSDAYLPQSAYRGYAGAGDLHRYGQWGYASSYGRVWWPSVSLNWVPYQHGRWIHHPRRGFTWVSNEPWGWMPYHYGRWSYVPSYSRWCWVPGGFAKWSPARVNFYFSKRYIGWSPLAQGRVPEITHSLDPGSRIRGLTLVGRGSFLDRGITPRTVVREQRVTGLRSGLDPRLEASLVGARGRQWGARSSLLTPRAPGLGQSRQVAATPRSPASAPHLGSVAGSGVPGVGRGSPPRFGRQRPPLPSGNTAHRFSVRREQPSPVPGVRGTHRRLQASPAINQMRPPGQGRSGGNTARSRFSVRREQPSPVPGVRGTHRRIQTSPVRNQMRFSGRARSMPRSNGTVRRSPSRGSRGVSRGRGSGGRSGVHFSRSRN